MSPFLVLLVISGYFLLLILISYFTSKGADSNTFFTGNRESPWYLVAFGMIGASLSGITFISLPGEVGNSYFFYFQLVLGYLLGYFIIAMVLLPLYYELNLVSIYTYLSKRYGNYSYKTGSLYFLLAQTIGASLRLFVVAMVLQLAFFDAFGIPFAVTVIITIMLIWVYTYRAGIKTIVWTDTLQTLFMLLSILICIYIIANDLEIPFANLVEEIREHDYAKTFNWDWRHKRNFFKQFFSGAFIAIVMTGLDQNMMQKNLTCKNLKEAQKNMLWFSVCFVVTNILLLVLGILLYQYAFENGISLPKEIDGSYENTDALFSTLALEHFGVFAGTIFLLGISAAAFSSADSALTALTTAFCVDFLDFESKPEEKKVRIRNRVHLGFSAIVILTILIFKALNDESVINAVFKIAGYTYGPLLGLFSLGLFTNVKVKDKWVPAVCLISPFISYVLDINSREWFGFEFGFTILLVNGLLTFLGLMVLRRSSTDI